jgi:hypothetical protein
VFRRTDTGRNSGRPRAAAGKARTSESARRPRSSCFTAAPCVAPSPAAPLLKTSVWRARSTKHAEARARSYSDLARDRGRRSHPRCRSGDALRSGRRASRTCGAPRGGTPDRFMRVRSDHTPPQCPSSHRPSRGGVVTRSYRSPTTVRFIARWPETAAPSFPLVLRVLAAQPLAANLHVGEKPRDEEHGQDDVEDHLAPSDIGVETNRYSDHCTIRRFSGACDLSVGGLTAWG